MSKVLSNEQFEQFDTRHFMPNFQESSESKEGRLETHQQGCCQKVVGQTMKTAMKSLKELCTINLLMTSVHPEIDDVDDDSRSCDSMEANNPYGPGDGPICRCVCDFYRGQYRVNHTTKEFISRLPLPQTVKELVREVATELCENHEHALALGDTWDPQPDDVPNYELLIAEAYNMIFEGNQFHIPNQ